MSHKYTLHVDYRERDLYLLISKLLENKYSQLNVELCKTNLELGDVIILNEKEEIISIIERKTLHDMLGSIKDGRYENQSKRLQNHALSNHDIIYLIEGNMALPGIDDKERNMLLSSMISINCFKKFSCVRTMSKIESSQYICRMLYKFSKENYCNTSDNDGSNTMIDFSNTNEEDNQTLSKNSDLQMIGLKKMKKNHEINSETIGLCMLCQVPSINEKTAHAILEHYGNVKFDIMIQKIREDPSTLNEIKVCTNGKFRKISKKIIENIINILL